MSLYNLASGELKKENNELKQEIKRLKGALQTHEILLQGNTKEIERLNNIINELERWLKERVEKLDIYGYDDDIFNGIELALQKLKELKGSNQENV